MTANSPQWVRVVVGGLHTLAFWVDATQTFAVVLQEFLGADLYWHLGLHEGADLFVGVTVCTDRLKNSHLRGTGSVEYGSRLCQLIPTDQ